MLYHNFLTQYIWISSKILAIMVISALALDVSVPVVLKRENRLIIWPTANPVMRLSKSLI